MIGKPMDEEKEYYALIKKVFDILAPFYDIATLPISRVRDKVVNFTNARKGSRILDVGTGTGKQAFAFAKRGYDMPLTIREKALKEMVRVTKPKGMVVIIDYALPENKVRRFLIYHLVKLYEGKYYLEFIKSDLKTLLRKSGIEMKEELPVLFGANSGS
ncbi:MAG: hypothetical protein AB1638_07120 [Nitrospirota bacterium]